MTPNAPLLVATCGPLLHLPCAVPPLMSHVLVSWKFPAVSMFFQPVSGAVMQSSVTSWNPDEPFTRVNTRFVFGYVGSVKKTYFWRNCAGGRMLTYSSSPRQSV